MLGVEEGVRESRLLLRSKDSSARHNAIASAAGLGLKDIKPELMEALTDKNCYSVATRALTNLGIREAVADIIPLLRAERWYDRECAVRAICLLGANEAAPQLAPLLKDENERVRAEAARALGVLGASEHATDIASLMSDREEPPRVQAAAALCRLGVRDAAARLLDMERGGRSNLYWTLNALREPETWKRLSRTRLDEGRRARRTSCWSGSRARRG